MTFSSTRRNSCLSKLGFFTSNTYVKANTNSQFRIDKKDVRINSISVRFSQLCQYWDCACNIRKCHKIIFEKLDENLCKKFCVKIIRCKGFYRQMVPKLQIHFQQSKHDKTDISATHISKSNPKTPTFRLDTFN